VIKVLSAVIAHPGLNIVIFCPNIQSIGNKVPHAIHSADLTSWYWNSSLAILKISTQPTGQPAGNLQAGQFVNFLQFDLRIAWEKFAKNLRLRNVGTLYLYHTVKL